jgi:hypothetical protein
MKFPSIGFPNAPAQLHDALLPAYRRFQKRQTRDTLLEVASVAWHLCERFWHDQGCKVDLGTFRATLFKECPELALLRDYVETAKHVGLTRESIRLVELTGAENPGGFEEITGPLGTLRTTPECTLTFNYAGGENHKVTDVIKSVVDFWARKLK